MPKNYFLGGNTSKGFFSYYDNLIDKAEANHMYVIKGGPGTGKSSMMKKVAQWAEDKGLTVDYIHCSSDPSSLDGILINEIKTAMVDGTAPHIVDPKYPGCCGEIINMGDCWNVAAIRENRTEIIFYADSIKEYFAQAYNYLEAAGALYRNMAEVCRKCAVMTTERDIAENILESEAKKHSISGRGKVRKLFASAITPIGVVSYADTLAAKKTYVIKCGMNLAGSNMMDMIAQGFAKKYYDIECYYDPLMPDMRIEHICVPESGVSILSDNMYSKVTSENIIDISGMLKCEEKAAEKFAETDEMVGKAVRVIEKAKNMHDELEKCYVPNMNFDMAEEKFLKVISELERLV